MKVRIKDWDEAVKAALADDEGLGVKDDNIFGIVRKYGAWGEVVEGYKDSRYFYGSNNFTYPLCVVDEIIEDDDGSVNPDDILRYGKTIADDAYGSVTTNFGKRRAVRIRLIAYEGELWYHKMVDGDVVECRKVGMADA